MLALLDRVDDPEDGEEDAAEAEARMEALRAELSEAGAPDEEIEHALVLMRHYVPELLRAWATYDAEAEGQGDSLRNWARLKLYTPPIDAETNFVSLELRSRALARLGGVDSREVGRLLTQWWNSVHYEQCLSRGSLRRSSARSSEVKVDGALGLPRLSEQYYIGSAQGTAENPSVAPSRPVGGGSMAKELPRRPAPNPARLIERAGAATAGQIVPAVVRARVEGRPSWRTAPAAAACWTRSKSRTCSRSPSLLLSPSLTEAVWASTA